MGIFPNMGGGGVFPIPKTQNPQKMPLNSPKITQKKEFFSKSPKKNHFEQGVPKKGGGGGG